MIERLKLVRPDVVLLGDSVGNGQEILLLHAGGESRPVWRPVMATLAARGFSAVAFDQRGHGESGGSPADGVRAYGDDAKAMILEMRRPVAVGASLGGIALMLALEELEAYVAGLVLVDVTPAPDPVRTRAYLAPRGGLGASPLVEDILSQAELLARIVAALRLPILLVCARTRLSERMGEPAFRRSLLMRASRLLRMPAILSRATRRTNSPGSSATSRKAPLLRAAALLDPRSEEPLAR